MSQCYCQQEITDHHDLCRMFKCNICQRHFHADCLKSGTPTTICGDIFFEFVCVGCSDTGQEKFERMVGFNKQFPWLPVIVLALYNLQLSNIGGKLGYYRWKEHICSFIDKHWNEFFPLGKRTHSWNGTIAGQLSAWNVIYFHSGMKELHESGWWKLVDSSPPSIEIMFAKKKDKLKNNILPDDATVPLELKERNQKKISLVIQAAIKAKRSRSNKKKKIKSVPSLDSSITDADVADDEILDDCISEMTDLSQASSCSFGLVECSSQVSRSSGKSEGWLTGKDLVVGDKIPDFLMKDDDEDDEDFEIDPCSMFPDEPRSSVMCDDILPNFDDMFSTIDGSTNFAKNKISDEWLSDKRNQLTDKEDGSMFDCENMRDEYFTRPVGSTANELSVKTENSQSDSDDQQSVVAAQVDIKVRKRKKWRMDYTEPVKEIPLVHMSVYEEKQLLKKLISLDDVIQNNPAARRFKTKLLVRQKKREHGLPVFNLDSYMISLSVGNLEPSLNSTVPENKGIRTLTTTNMFSRCSTDRILDRYQVHRTMQTNTQTIPFINRLIGSDDNKPHLIYSPYTTNRLKPFIRRDYESRPIRLRLLQEIISYHHRGNPNWIPDPLPPIDFCYVQPQHIPSVNALCREFFWPGIDLSECLQYPDFSCVVLYRKFVVGFAFMVPDVKYNETYISFIFTHPEFRRVGIASFMLYHLFHVSPSKDITLHVSTSNPALMLYQKFGFKEEEFIKDFYDKYFPEESTECRHAFLLRMKR